MKFWSSSVKVGLMVLVAFILLATLLINSGNLPWGTQGDEITFQFRAVNGLYVGSGVLLSGVSIGKVTHIILQPEANTVEIRARVKNAFQWLRKGCEAHISMSGFVGEIFISLKNGEVEAPPLQPSDLPIVGIDPVNPLELLEQTSSGLSKAIDLTSAANELLQANQEEIQQGIKETRGLVAQTGETLKNFNENMDETVRILLDLAAKNDKRVGDTLNNMNQLLTQLGNDSLILSSQISDISRSLLTLVDQNFPRVNRILSDLQQGTTDFRSLATQSRQDLSSITKDISNLIAQGSTVIEEGSTEIKPIIKNLQSATASLSTLNANVNEILVTIKDGRGTVSQLLNNPEPLADAKETFNNLNELLVGLTNFYEQTDEQLKGFKFPDFSWDTELQYLSLEENLHTEFGFSLIPLPPSKNSYRFGLGIREEKIGVEFQYAYKFNDYLRGRFGFIRSNVGAGVDLMMWNQRLVLGIESVGLTQDRPELNAEMSFRFYRSGHIIFGIENWWSKDRRWTAGLKLITSDW